MNKETILIFLILSLVLTPVFHNGIIPSVHATVYLSDDFESFPTDWTLGKGGEASNMLKSEEQKHGGSYSCVVNTTAVAQLSYAYRTCTVTAMTYHVVGWVYVSSDIASSNSPVFGFWSGAYYAFATYINKSGSTYYINNMLSNTPTWEQVCPITADTWNRIDVYVNRTLGKTHYYLNTVKQGGNLALASNASSAKCYLGDTNAAYYYGKQFLDDFSVDSDAEPTPSTNYKINLSLPVTYTLTCITSTKYNIPTALNPGYSLSLSQQTDYTIPLDLGVSYVYSLTRLQGFLVNLLLNPAYTFALGPRQFREVLPTYPVTTDSTLFYVAICLAVIALGFYATEEVRRRK